MAFDCSKCGKHYSAGWPAKGGICYRCSDKRTPIPPVQRAENVSTKQKKPGQWDAAEAHWEANRKRKVAADEWVRASNQAEQDGLDRASGKAATEAAKTYGERDDILRQLGFKDYPEYLASPLWVGIWQETFNRFGRTCSICRKRATQIHHAQYDLATMQGKNLEHLYPICPPCHEMIEILDGRKVTLRHAMDRFRAAIGKPPLPRKKIREGIEREIAKRAYIERQHGG